MQPIAAWLVARPQNGILILAGSVFLPLSPILSGTVMALLALFYGARLASLQAVGAAAILAIAAVLLNAPAVQIVLNAGSTWMPALLLALALRHWRSLTLVLQVSVILAVVVTLAFYVVLGDPTDYWNSFVASMIEVLAEAGLAEQAELLSARQAAIVPQMTMLFVFFSWSLYVLVLLLGYALFQCLPERDGIYGRFRELNFGRVLALVLAVASVAALVSGAAWLQNTALVIFVVFWFQGLALLHWLKAQGRLPVFVLIASYAMLPILNVLLIMAFAVVGYTDAWFDYRARIRSQEAQ